MKVTCSRLSSSCLESLSVSIPIQIRNIFCISVCGDEVAFILNFHFLTTTFDVIVVVASLRVS